MIEFADVVDDVLAAEAAVGSGAVFVAVAAPAGPGVLAADAAAAN